MIYYLEIDFKDKHKITWNTPTKNIDEYFHSSGATCKKCFKGKIYTTEAEARMEYYGNAAVQKRWCGNALCNFGLQRPFMRMEED